MGKKSSKQWLKEHFSDPFVKEAQKQGYRGRAAFKLIELNEKDKLLAPGMRVVDLGAAPGSWMQVASRQVGATGHVYALDILPMDGHENATVIQGDFRSDEVLNQLLLALENKPVQLVMSDMAPNMSGNKAIDGPKSLYLVELAIDFADRVLEPGGCFLTKIFHGSGFDETLKMMREKYERVVIRKPKASRDRSKEVYLLAKGYKG